MSILIKPEDQEKVSIKTYKIKLLIFFINCEEANFNRFGSIREKTSKMAAKYIELKNMTKN